MKELSKQLMCIYIRNGIEIWTENDKILKLKQAIRTLQGNKFIEFDERFINTADIVGIFTPQDLEDLKHRKNGEWKCESGTWHIKEDNCECGYLKRIKEHTAQYTRG